MTQRICLTQRSHDGQDISKQIQQNEVAHFNNASRADGACVDTPGSSSGTQILSKVARSWPGDILLQYPWCVSLKRPSSHSLENFLTNLHGTELVLGV